MATVAVAELPTDVEQLLVGRVESAELLDLAGSGLVDAAAMRGWGPDRVGVARVLLDSLPPRVGIGYGDPITSVDDRGDAMPPLPAPSVPSMTQRTTREPTGRWWRPVRLPEGPSPITHRECPSWHLPSQCASSTVATWRVGI